MRDYAHNAQFNWEGGPHDGTYNSPEDIRVVWEKFTKCAGPLKVSVDKLEDSANPKGSTVSANVQFEGKAPIKVRYVPTFLEGKIASETWQIDPKLGGGFKLPSLTRVPRAVAWSGRRTAHRRASRS
jgi:hypothetical protein